MEVLAAPGLVALTRVLAFETHEPIQFVDVTEQVRQLIHSVGFQDGIVTVFSRHTTAAVRVQEDEPLLLEDLRAFLERCAPASHAYRHNDFRVRTEHMHDDESPNGHSHCLHLLLGASESVPVGGAEMLLGTWQRLFLVELDGPRVRREVIVQLVGTVG